jgi:hypothetical protein
MRKTRRSPLPILWIRCGLLAATILLALFVLRTNAARELPTSPPPKLEHFAATGHWYTALAAALSMVLAAATAHRWLAPRHSSTTRRSLPPVKRAHWAALLAILVLALFVRWPRMNLSLYADEAYTVQRQIHGIHQYERLKTDDGRHVLIPFESTEELIPAFRPVSWRETLWRNPIGNNHLLFNVLSRSKLDAWKSIGAHRPEHFSLTVLRMPSLLAALGTLVMLFFLGRRDGGVPGA